MLHNQNRLARTAAALCCALVPALTHGQIVSDATGTIDLMLNPFFDAGWVWSDEANGFVYQPLVSQHQYTSVGLSGINASFDGGGYYSAGGDTRFDYDYQATGPGESSFSFHAYALADDAGDGSGGYSKLDMQITFSHPVAYRFEAEPTDFPMSYKVMFNGNEASAYGGGYGIREGTFPLIWLQEDGVNVFAYDFGTHIDQGILPAGTYDLSVYAYTGLHRYGIGLISEGTASLHIQLLGDADQDGLVGIDDMNIILAHWGVRSRPMPRTWATLTATAPWGSPTSMRSSGAGARTYVRFPSRPARRSREGCYWRWPVSADRAGPPSPTSPAPNPRRSTRE